MADLPWAWIIGLGATGILMALASCLIGMRAKVENPAWWVLYTGWVVAVLAAGLPKPFWTIWFASILAGVLHGTVTSLLLDSYKANNPWYEEKLQKPRRELVGMFMGMGLVVGIAFGALVGGVAWGLTKLGWF